MFRAKVQPETSESKRRQAAEANELLGWGQCLLLHVSERNTGLHGASDPSTNLQSLSYFTTSGLPPVSSSWRQAP
jgi:hypothetical protein